MREILERLLEAFLFVYIAIVLLVLAVIILPFMAIAAIIELENKT